MNVPNLFIVGPPRSGTTSLIEWLVQHPQIGRPRLKEPMYHATDLVTPQRVADRSAYLAMYAELEPAAYLIDATPWYLYSRRAAASIAEMSADAHIIIGLRDPAEVLASLHGRHVLVGLEPEVDFGTAVFGPPRPVDHREFRRSLDYLAVGRFGEQVARYVAAFPAERVHFVATHDLAERPQEVHLRLLTGLGLDPQPLRDYTTFNAAQQVGNQAIAWLIARIAGSKRSGRARRAVASRLARRAAKPGRAQVAPETMRTIREALRADLHLLQQLSGYDVSAWTGE